ncbi:polysaccharide lyase [Aromatoleum tolulyticum]|nr:polysaccharide lyase [Aromatoleum tolulyticum]
MISRSENYQKVLLAFAFSVAFTPAFAQVDRARGNAATPANFASRYALQTSHPENLTWTPDPASSKRMVLKAIVRDTDQKVFGGLRTEIVPLNEYVREGVRWYAISVYFPEDWIFHPYPVIVGQLHTSQKGRTLSPPLAFVVHGQNLDLELYANHRLVDDATQPSRENSARQLIRLASIMKESWYCFVVRADWSRRLGEGSIKIWMNGDKVYESYNLYNQYETWLGNYPKAGLYVPGMMGVKERMLLLDFIYLGGPRTGYQEMAALTPCAGAKVEDAE